MPNIDRPIMKNIRARISGRTSSSTSCHPSRVNAYAALIDVAGNMALRWTAQFALLRIFLAYFGGIDAGSTNFSS